MENMSLNKDNKYNLLKQSIETGEYLSSDDLDNQIDTEILINLINKTELTGKKIDMLLYYTSRYSYDALNYLMSKMPSEEEISMLKKLEERCDYSTYSCVNIKRYIEEKYLKTDCLDNKPKELKSIIKDILEVIFKNSVTFEPINKELELSPAELIIVFLKYKDDMKKLKMLIEKAILPQVRHHLPSREYLRNIAIAYGTIYDDYQRVDLIDFVNYFESNFAERKAIQLSRTSIANVLDYEQCYEDDNVRIYYVSELNGYYVEKKEAKIYNEKFYIYPEEDSEGNKVIVRRDNISAFDLYTEYKSKKAYYGSVPRYKWPDINIDNFIDLSCDDSLKTIEEKYEKTKEIIGTTWTLSLIMHIDKKVYQKESNK